MKCEYDNEITLKALNILHRDILLGDAESQEADIEALVQLVRYFASRSVWSTLAEEAENLKRAAGFLRINGELKRCAFPKKEELPMKSVERFSAFDRCYSALRQGILEGHAAFQVQYDPAAETLAVRVMQH